NGLIERRPDPDDRRANRLFLTPAAGPLMEHLDRLGNELMATVLDGIDPDAIRAMIGTLAHARDNLRHAIHDSAPTTTLAKAQGYPRPQTCTRRERTCGDRIGAAARALAARPALRAADRRSPGRRYCRPRHLSRRRPLHLNRQRLCGRPEGADHARHFR